MLLVLAVLGLLASLVASVSMGRINQSKEAALKEDLHLLRKGIDDFYADTGKYPAQLEDLVERHYLRIIPPDPFTEKNDTWQTVAATAKGEKGGIRDVHSGSEERSSDGQNYSDW